MAITYRNIKGSPLTSTEIDANFAFLENTTIALGETPATAYRGDRGKIAYDHSNITTANPHAVTFASIIAKPTTIAGYGITDYDVLWDARFLLKSTDNLSEGITNLYYTEARVAANTAVALNTAKVSDINHNVSTNLSATHNLTNVVIASSDGTDATIGAASSVQAGIMSKAIYDAHVLNNAKVGNIPTSLSIGLRSQIALPIDSDGSVNDISLPLADSNYAGIISSILYNKIIVNNGKVSDINHVAASTTDNLSEGTTNLYYTEARVAANISVALNTAKVSDINHNVTTNLSRLQSLTDVTIISSDGTDATIGAASSVQAGIMSKAIYDAHVLNNAKVGNIPTSLSIGLRSQIALPIDSDGSVNDISLPLADSNYAGIISSILYNKIIVNNGKVSFPGFTSLFSDYGFTDNSTNWNTAFGWGNHALAGYSTDIHTNITALNAVSGTNTGDQTAGVGIVFSGSDIKFDANSLGVGTTLIGTDHLVAANGASSNKQLISAIPLSIFNNDLGWTSGTGSVISVSAGTGLVLTGTFDINPILSVRYSGFSNFINSATNLEGTAIATADKILYHDATDNTVKKGLISDLPFVTNNNQITNGAGYITSYTDTNTWRGITGAPALNDVGTSISSGWAYNHALSSTAHPRDTRSQIAGTYNPTIGYNGNFTTTGKEVIDTLYLTNGVITNVTTRFLTASLSGSGTTNYLPKFTGATTLGNSLISDDGIKIDINGELHCKAINYNGAVGTDFIINNIKAGGLIYYADQNGHKFRTWTTSWIDAYVISDTGNNTWIGSGSFTNATASTSTTTGALVVTGGVGIGGVTYTRGIISRYASFELSGAGILDSTSTRIISSLGTLYLQNGSGNKIQFRGKTGLNTGYIDNSGNLNMNGTATFGGSITSYDFSLTSSDIRLKKDIFSLRASPKLNIDYKSFRFKKDDSKIKYGVIAQELELVCPDLVSTDKKGFKSVSYTELLVREVAYLKGQNDTLNKRLEKLETLILNN